MTERPRQLPPLINKESLLDLPTIDDAGILGYEAMALIRLFVTDIPFSLYVTGSDGDDELYGLLTTPKQNRLGLFSLSALELAREEMGVPILCDWAYVSDEIRDIAYRHSVQYPTSNPWWARKQRWI